MNAAGMADLAPWMNPAFCGVETDVTAGGTGDATEVSSAFFALTDAVGVTILIAYTATLAEGETMTIAANMQDADNVGGTNVADFGDAVAATVVATGGSGGTTETGVAVMSFPVAGAREFGRIQWTPNCSASGTDTAKLTAVAIRTGSKIVPPTDDDVTRLN